MELTKTQKQLIALLKAFKMTENQVIGIMLTLRKEEQQNKMIDFIIENKDKITNEEILMKMEQLIEN